ncbi:MAG: hypothetical protein ABI406_11595 [Ktedonobacteraceae bacterium]
MKSKVFVALGMGLAFGTGVAVGLTLPVLFIWRIIRSLPKSIELTEAGTPVMATVTRIATFKVGKPFIIPSSRNNRNTTPGEIYRLFACWQHPETGKKYTLSGMIKDPNEFQVGSSAPFMVNYSNPKFHHLEQIPGERTDA